MAASNPHWTSGITQVQPNELRLRGYRLDELMGHITYAQAVYLALFGELPDPAVARLLDAILVASIDHGVTPPSTLAARTAASTGAPLNAALAAGILSINRHHGGAIEDCMHQINAVLTEAQQSGLSLETAANRFVEQSREQKRRLAGFGHRVHTDDPRTARLFEVAAAVGISASGVQVVHLLAEALHTQTGRRLPVNVDGAIAALLTDMGLPAELANAFFIMARVPGLVAHIHEEQTRQRPMRRIHPTDHSYDGPQPREYILP